MKNYRFPDICKHFSFHAICHPRNYWKHCHGALGGSPSLRCRFFILVDFFFGWLIDHFTHFTHFTLQSAPKSLGCANAILNWRRRTVKILKPLNAAMTWWAHHENNSGRNHCLFQASVLDLAQYPGSSMLSCFQRKQRWLQSYFCISHSHRKRGRLGSYSMWK